MLVSGQVSLVGLFEWLQVLELNRRNVVLRFRRRGEAGVLRVAGGQPVQARCGSIAGDAAAARLLTWTDAHFEQERSIDPAPGDVTRSNYDLMLEAMDAVPASAGANNPLDPDWRVTGDLIVTSVLQLLQLAELNRRRLVLRVTGEVEGEVLFDAGQVVAAHAGKAANEEAVYRLLGALLGAFELAPLAAAPTAEFEGRVQELLVEGVRRADEARLLRGEPLPDPDPTTAQLLRELAAGALSPPVRLAMAKRYQPHGEATPVPVLLRLAYDPDASVRAAAVASLDRLPIIVRQILAYDEETPPAIRAHLTVHLADAPPEDLPLPPDDEYPRGIQSRLRDLPMADKMFLAAHGTRNERLILMRHPSRRVAIAAYESMRTTEQDVEVISASSSANGEVLAAIARDPRFNAKYSVVRSLVFNSKTPDGDAVRLVPRLRDGDLHAAWREADLAEPVRHAIRKRLRARDVKRKF